MTDKITTIDGLAEMIQRTMASKEDLAVLRSEMASKEDLNALRNQLEQKMDAGFFAVNRRMDLLHEDLSDLPTIREALQDFRQRLERVEKKVGLAR